MSNRRMMLRRHRRLPVTLGGRLTAVTADVSATGFSAEMMQVFMPGAVVHGTIGCGGRDLPFKGEVSWAEAGHPRLSIASRFGVQFTGEVPGLAELLQNNAPPSRPPNLRPATSRRRKTQR